MRAIRIVVAQVFFMDRIERSVNGFFAHRKGFMTMLATDLHRSLLSPQSKVYNTIVNSDSLTLTGYNLLMTRFYTQTGDDGTTGLLGEGRFSKHDPRLEAVGTLDEVTAVLGMARAASQTPQTASVILAVQRDLYNMMAEVSATAENAARFRAINAQRVAWLEEQTDAISATISIPNEFIVPGDTEPGAVMSFARTVVRRAERRVVRLYHNGDLQNQDILRYLNRLSSLCFVLELLENQASGKASPTLAKQ
jgi:cob(I)alamin adenosyltransferase